MTQGYQRTLIADTVNLKNEKNWTEIQKKNKKTQQGMNQYEPHVWTISNMFKSCQDYSL